MTNISVILLMQPDKKFAFQRRTLDAYASPGKLGLFGGHAEAGETALQTMKRELTEETSLPTEELKIKHVGDRTIESSTGDKENKIFHVYWAMIDPGKFDVYEGDGSESFAVDEALARNDLAKSTRKILESIRSDKWRLV